MIKGVHVYTFLLECHCAVPSTLLLFLLKDDIITPKLGSPSWMDDLLGVQLGRESEHESSGRVPIIIESEMNFFKVQY